MFTYQLLLNYYGSSHSAESKYIKFVKGVMLNRESSSRLALFASFVGVTPYNEGDFEFYVKGRYFIQKQWYIPIPKPK